MQPFVLAIVGRPNVGKSTLFNRLVGRRLALVDDQPGVTRDRRLAMRDWAIYGFRLLIRPALRKAVPDRCRHVCASKPKRQLKKPIWF